MGVACVGGGIVKCRVALDRGGYVPGENIIISALISNGSKVTIKSTKAALTETIQYLARGKVVQTEKRELAAVSRRKIRPGQKDEWVNEMLYVPPLPPTNLKGCHLIKIQYDVFVRISKLLTCKINLIILFISVYYRTKIIRKASKVTTSDYVSDISISEFQWGHKQYLAGICA